MFALYVMLYLGAFFLGLFAFLFLGGALIYLVSLFAEALRAVGSSWTVKAEAPQPRPAVQPTIPFKARQAEIYPDGAAAYAGD